MPIEQQILRNQLTEEYMRCSRLNYNYPQERLRHRAYKPLLKTGIAQRWRLTMSYKRGDIVLVLFPNSDLRTAKRRPALIVQADDLATTRR